MEQLKRMIFLLVVIFAATLFLGQSSSSSDSSGFRVGVVELEEAVRKSKRGKDVLSALEAEVKKTESELDAEKSVIVQLKKEYDAKKSMWDEMTKKQKASEIDLKEQALARKARDYQGYYMKKQTEAVKPLIRDFEELIDRLGREQNYDIIFEISGAVLYINDGVKVTDEVIRYADSTF